MRILAIRGSNIASLTEFDIDFQAEPLRSAGIFAITGPTGAGKSSLLDAMCLALYQRAPRLDDLSGRETKVESRFGEIGQADIRNLLRRGCETGHAECDFLGGDGCSYRARWGYRAAKRKGAAVQEEMSLVRLDDGQVLVGSSSRKGEFQSQILSLIGLSYGQFMRTVMLAQGRFAEFLRSNEDERADLLEKLTGTEIYGRISKKIFEKTREAREQVGLIERDLDGLSLLDRPVRDERAARLAELEALVPGLESTRGDLRRFLDGLERLASVRRLREEISTQVETVRARTESVKRDLAAAKVRWELVEEDKIRRLPEIARARDLDATSDAAEGVLSQRTSSLEETRRALELSEGRIRELLETRTRLAGEIDADREWLGTRRTKLEPLAENWGLWREKLGQADRIRRELSSAEDAKGRIAYTLLEASARCEELDRELAEIAIPDGLRADDLHDSLESISLRRKRLQAALPYLELDFEIRELEQKLSERAAELPRLESRCAILESGWSTAKRLLDETRIALSGDVEHLRAGLQDGCPCPVCGSGEHPWAKTLPKLDALLERHAKEEQTANQAYETCKRELGGERAQADAQRQILTKSRQRLDAMALDADLSRELEGESNPVEWVKTRIVELAQNENQGLARLKELHRYEELRSRSVDSRTKRDLAKAALEAETEKVASARTTLEECLASLDGPFGSTAWRVKWKDNPAFAEQVTISVTEYLARRESLERNLRKDEPLDAAIAAQSEMLEVRRTDRGRCELEVAQAQEELAGLRKQRATLLDGATVADSEEAIEAGLLEARRSHEEFRQAYDRERVQAAALEGREIETERQEEKQLLELRELERLHLGESTGIEDPSLRLEKARQKTAIVESEIASMRREQAELGVVLARDSENRERAGGLVLQLSGARDLLGDWSLLCDQIGSADGKSFKRIAQQFTLEILLEEANVQLLTVAPRYSLRMLGNSMHFGVLDHESYEELRPVQTLSGGESFLVSLGLALGLSRMAGGDLTVESLFIDEGFGTLDAETLQGVMAALSTLHAQGRKVGLITHVEEMKEQIPVRIEVVKTGQGASRVEVRG